MRPFGNIREAVQVTARIVERVTDQKVLQPGTDVMEQLACLGAHDKRL